MIKTFSSANDWPILGYIPVGECYNINICPAQDTVVLYLFIVGVKFPSRFWNTPPCGREQKRLSMWVRLQKVMVSSVILQSHWNNIPTNNNSSTQNSSLFQEWLSWQADIELTDWPPRSPDLSTIEDTWMEMKKIMQETWSDLPQGSTVVICTLVSDALNELQASPFSKQRSISN